MSGERGWAGKQYLSVPIPENVADRAESAMSSEAIALHIAAVKLSVDSERPGFVLDADLPGLPGGTSADLAIELCLGRVWERIPQGYRIEDHQAIDDVLQHRSDRAYRLAQCPEEGPHLLSSPSDWFCARCLRIL